LAIGIIAVAAALLFRSSLPPQPYYQGRSLDSWLDEWATNRWGSNSSKYTEVVAAIGTNSIPFVFRRLERDDSPLKNRYREIWPKLPGFVRKFFLRRNPNPFYDFFTAEMATYAFQSCGSNAVPLLLPRLKDGNPAVREACVSSLPGLMRMSASETISMFLPFLDDSDPMVRGHAVSLIGQLGPTASNAIPALIRNLQSNEAGRHKFVSETVFVRGSSAWALGLIGPTAAGAVPALTNLLASTERYTRTSAATALWEITSNANLSLPVLISAFPTYDQYSKPGLIETFGQMGPLAKPALPLLINELTNSDPRILEMLTNAVKRIDLEAAEKAGIK
jgi:hypothetical protein